MTTKRGCLIALEGIDGCGKSTQARQLVATLTDKGHPAVTFREPGDSEYGQELRRVFVEGRDITPEEEMRLFLEDRRIDVRDNIEPALASGKHVVMDRYYLSSVVYQGVLGLDPAMIRSTNEAIAPRPDLTLILDLPVDVALQRIEAARGGANSFEGRAYLEKVRALYLTFADENSIETIAADTTPDAVQAALVARVLALVAGSPPA
ncbi:MAG: dTMP kinase [Acidobacteria bacterium]|nr:dTMP kinase [Acidobacteriota bacterium]